MQQALDLWDARAEFTRIHDFGKSLRLADLAATPDPAQGSADAANTVLVARAVTLSKAALDLNGVSLARG